METMNTTTNKREGGEKDEDEEDNKRMKKDELEEDELETQETHPWSANEEKLEQEAFGETDRWSNGFYTYVLKQLVVFTLLSAFVFFFFVFFALRFGRFSNFITHIFLLLEQFFNSWTSITSSASRTRCSARRDGRRARRRFCECLA